MDAPSPQQYTLALSDMFYEFSFHEQDSHAYA
jgi:hypothetical protein